VVGVVAPTVVGAGGGTGPFFIGVLGVVASVLTGIGEVAGVGEGAKG
jgi:hypothetical protein